MDWNHGWGSIFMIQNYPQLFSVQLGANNYYKLPIWLFVMNFWTDRGSNSTNLSNYQWRLWMTLLVKVELRYSTIQPSSCWCKRSIGSRLVPSFSHYSNHMLVSTYILHIGKRRKENLTKVQIWQSNLDCSNSNLLSWGVKIIMPKLEN